MSKITGSNVLITGGGNGIGKLLGEKCLKEGAANVIIWDINPKNIDSTIKEFNNRGFQNVHGYVVDVSDVDDIEKNATDVLLNIGNVDILVNNAGIVVGKRFWDHTTKEIERTVDINIKGVMHVTRVFLPDMMRQNRGHIVNIASAAGHIPVVNQSIYSSSKWSVVGFSETLRLELEKDKYNIKMLTVCPSYINTGMFTGVKAPMLTPIMEPDDIVNKIINGIKRDEMMLLEPFITKVIPFIKGILPLKYSYMVLDMIGVLSSMEHFRGRSKDEAVPEKRRTAAKK
jgi:all-trans-retinol dehydrogenase (NAD+)